MEHIISLYEKDEFMGHEWNCIENYDDDYCDHCDYCDCDGRGDWRSSL